MNRGAINQFAAAVNTVWVEDRQEVLIGRVFGELVDGTCSYCKSAEKYAAI